MEKEGVDKIRRCAIREGNFTVTGSDITGPEGRNHLRGEFRFRRKVGRTCVHSYENTHFSRRHCLHKGSTLSAGRRGITLLAGFAITHAKRQALGELFLAAYEIYFNNAVN